MTYTEETFPYNNWCMKFTEEERPVVDNWRINIIKYATNPCPSNYINYLGLGGWGMVGWLQAVGGVLITFSDFQHFVLKEQINSEPENMDYLIDIFKKWNIK